MFLGRKRQEKYGVVIPLTSLIDIVFLLLIYFLLTTNFLTEEGIAVNLPQARNLKDSSNTEITIHLPADGAVYLDQVAIEPGDLLQSLRQAVAGTANPVVIVKADKNVLVDKVVNILDVAKASGVERVLLATERKL